jgi:flagellar L-ring protein precursor FlgH
MNKLFSLLVLIASLQACATPEPVMTTLTPSPDFAPVYPLASEQNRPATGGIYGNRQSDAWFGRGRNYQVGDLVTVLLNESTQAARSQKPMSARMPAILLFHPVLHLDSLNKYRCSLA